MGSPEKRFSINFSKTNTKFDLSLHYNHDNSYLFVNRKEIYRFKANDKSLNFPTKFCLGSIFNKFGDIDSREVNWKENVFYLSVDCNAIGKFVILNIHKYLMVKKNM